MAGRCPGNYHRIAAEKVLWQVIRRCFVLPKLPRNLSQGRALRAFIRAGGAEVRDRGKGSHRAVLMPNGHLVVLPMTLKVGLLATQIKAAELTAEEFIDLL